MFGVDVFLVLIGLAVAAVALAGVFGVTESVRDGENMHDLRLEVHRLHRIYLARLRGEDDASIDAFAESDVELVAEPASQPAPEPGQPTQAQQPRQAA